MRGAPHGDGRIDDAVRQLRLDDADGDGRGNAPGTLSGCLGLAAGHVEVAGDRDDADARRAPGLAEACDGVDNDCDGAVDEDPGLCGP